MEYELKIEKPLAYLDQNILDLFVKGNTGLMDELSSKFHVVYSDETLKEIKRSGENAFKFIEILKKLEAYHVRINVEAGSFLIKGDATVNSTGVEYVYQDYLDRERAEEDDVVAAGNKWLHKFFGGQPNLDFASLYGEQRATFSALVEKIESLGAETDDEVPGLAEVLRAKKTELLADFERSISEIESRMQEDIGDGVDWSGVSDFRGSIQLGPVELNNIESPDVVKKIWELVQKKEEHFKNISVEQFLSFKQAAAQPERALHTHEKIHAIYNMLNMVGYFPDTKQHNERRFVSAQSDAIHASMAGFCQVVVSRDERFVKKLSAALEYLNLNTQVFFVKTQNA
ncbi:hypothetical protein [Marinobacter sp. JSM 1782161]|uniref:hypothetical protein n=1 Tax=Marinobacter sp. JSM 1782161 TaxID=2685906 RepID=UPI001401E625|nr:hypothetical protein [Marinobacter sp. JSM 1782161]